MADKRVASSKLEFTCRKCGKRKPWSEGAADAHPDWCDECWAKKHPGGKDCPTCKAYVVKVSSPPLVSRDVIRCPACGAHGSARDRIKKPGRARVKCRNCQVRFTVYATLMFTSPAIEREKGGANG